MASFDQSTFLAYRVIQAQEMGPPKVPAQVALPGAKAAIAHDRLLAHQDAGHDQHQIVSRVNDRWASDNTAVIADQQKWTQGPYADAIQQMREKAAQEAAEKLRRETVFQQIVQEREEH